MDDDCLTFCRVVTCVGLLGSSDRALVRHTWCATAMGEMKALLRGLKLIFLFARIADFVPTVLVGECQETVLHQTNQSCGGGHGGISITQ